MNDHVTYKQFLAGDVVVVVMRAQYPNRVYYKRKFERRYTDNKTKKRESTAWLTYDQDDGDEALARQRATRWVHKQQKLDKAARERNRVRRPNDGGASRQSKEKVATTSSDEEIVW